MRSFWASPMASGPDSPDSTCGPAQLSCRFPCGLTPAILPTNPSPGLPHMQTHRLLPFPGALWPPSLHHKLLLLLQGPPLPYSHSVAGSARPGPGTCTHSSICSFVVTSCPGMHQLPITSLQLLEAKGPSLSQSSLGTIPGTQQSCKHFTKCWLNRHTA